MARHREPGQDEWLEVFDRALRVAEEVLAVPSEEYGTSELLQTAASGALNDIRTATAKLSRSTLGSMPEVMAADIADIRNLALYEYPTRRAELVRRTLANQIGPWRAGVDRARAVRADAEPATAPPGRADGSLQRARGTPLCGRPVTSANEAPCVLARGHGGGCRSA